MENGRTLLSGWIRSAPTAKREKPALSGSVESEIKETAKSDSANRVKVETGGVKPPNQPNASPFTPLDRFIVKLKYRKEVLNTKTKLPVETEPLNNPSDLEKSHAAGTSIFKPKASSLIDMTPPSSQTAQKPPQPVVKTNPAQSKQLWDSIFKRASKPAMIVKLKLPKTVLKQLVSPEPNKKRSIKMSGSAPFGVEHVRTFTRIPARTFPKRRKTVSAVVDGAQSRTKSTVENLANLKIDSDTDKLVLAPSFDSIEALKPAKRKLASCEYICDSIAKLNTDIDAEEYSQVKPFDFGSFESRLWSQKYSRHHMNARACMRIRSWIQTARNDGDSEDEEQEGGDNVLVVEGPVGSGKTSAVYSAAEMCDSFVFEVSSAVKRTGKALSQLLAGISQNHAVHQASHVVILIDEADIVYEPEANQFWTTISKYAQNTRRPVILTCQHAEPVVEALSLVHPISYSMQKLELQTAADLAWSAALGEGHFLEKSKVKLLVAHFQCDLRKTLNWLHFWCQMGVNGHPCGSDWAPKYHEMVDNDRVLSMNSWFPLPSVDSETGRNGIDVVNEIESLTTCPDLFTKSELDIIRSFPVCTRASPDETVWHHNALVLNSFYDCDVDVDVCGTKTKTIKAVKATDLDPYTRVMAAADLRRVQLVENEVRNGPSSSKRLALRALASEGLDTRQYLNLHYSDLLQLLRTGFSKR